ncbi:MAG: iron chelate uptake ABC transporter family permease subunit, partial [Spirochaetales bacterium]|nr:iron chelate uptake ABC transporter family permease subunit [Candidatus Physcosoma equi]
LLVLASSTLLVASVVSVTGLISFAGLIAPHIAKMMTKRENSRTLVLSSLVGAFILLLSDILSRSLGSAEIPISILTTFIGVPVLVYFMCRRRGGRV